MHFVKQRLAFRLRACSGGHRGLQQGRSAPHRVTSCAHRSSSCGHGDDDAIQEAIAACQSRGGVGGSVSSASATAWRWALAAASSGSIARGLLSQDHWACCAMAVRHSPPARLVMQGAPRLMTDCPVRGAIAIALLSTVNSSSIWMTGWRCAGLPTP